MLRRSECPRCQAVISADDAHCPACNAPTEASPGNVATRESRQAISADSSPRRPLIDNPYAVLAAVFLAMAVLGIPLIWMCRAWSSPVKVLLTLLTLAYTAVIFWLFWLTVVWVYGRLNEAGIVLFPAHGTMFFA